MHKYVFSIVVIVLLMTSCISRKQIIYLQEKNGEVRDSTMIMSKINIKPYRVQSLDILSIILKAPDESLVAMFKTSNGKAAESQESLYFNGFTVDDRGFIRVPVLGEIYVLGMTLNEIRLEVERLLLKDYFNEEANIFVDVKLPGVSYTINGEVGSTGVKVIFKDRATILEAIANAGDISITGDRKDVMILRQYPHGAEIHTIDLTSIDVMNSPYYYIQSNDYIYVKPLKEKTWGTGVTGVSTLTSVFQVFTIATTVLLLLVNIK